MTGIDVQTQTQYRDGESQTSFFHLLHPPDWQIAVPDPWVLAGCPISFSKRETLFDVKTEEDAPEHWVARPKEKEKNHVPFVFHTQPKVHANFLFLEGNRHVLEPFASLPLEDLEDLEHRVTSKAGSYGLYPSFTGQLSAVGLNWFSRLPQGLSKHAPSDDSNLLVKESQPAKSNQRNYVAYLGRHRKILTPRCDPSLVVRMERANAVILLQRCLRGRAAQVRLTETRLRVLELYPELNQLEGQTREPRRVDAADDGLGYVKALVGRELYSIFSSMQIAQNSSSNSGFMQAANMQG